MMTLSGMVDNTMQHLKPMAPTALEEFGSCEIHKRGRIINLSALVSQSFMDTWTHLKNSIHSLL